MSALPGVVCLPHKLAVAAFGALSYVARHSTDKKIEEALKQFEAALTAESAPEDLRAENARLREALNGLTGWYRALPEPGLVPDNVTLGARLREARAALAQKGA